MSLSPRGQGCSPLQQIEHANTSFCLIGEMAQFGVSAVTQDGSGGGQSQMMPLQRKDNPITEGHFSVNHLFVVMSYSGSAYSTTSTQVLGCCPMLAGHWAQSWMWCAPLLFSSVWSSTKQPQALFNCIWGTQNWWAPFGSRPVCKTTQETRNDGINMLMSCICLLSRAPQSLLTLSLVHMLHYLLGF